MNPTHICAVVTSDVRYEPHWVCAYHIESGEYSVAPIIGDVALKERLNTLRNENFMFAVEVSGGFGYELARELHDLGYRQYQWKRLDIKNAVEERSSTYVGWETNAKTEPMLRVSMNLNANDALTDEIEAIAIAKVVAKEYARPKEAVK